MDAFVKLIPSGGNLVYGNLKPRIRMAVVYYLANLKKLLVLGTTNRSELEIGYFTKYGDGGVDIEPIADLYKTEVFELAKELKIPTDILETAPTAALWPGQTDEKELGVTYFELDTVLKMINLGFGKKEILYLTGVKEAKLEKILARKIANAHKLVSPPKCILK
jgi:NAD+ synthase